MAAGCTPMRGAVLRGCAAQGGKAHHFRKAVLVRADFLRCQVSLARCRAAQFARFQPKINRIQPPASLSARSTKVSKVCPWVPPSTTSTFSGKSQWA